MKAKHVGLVLVLAVAASARLGAVAGVADTVIVVQDFTAEWKWAEELTQWETVISNTADQISKADQLLRLVGNPEEMMKQVVQSVPDLMKPLDEAIGLQSRTEALKMANSLYHLDSVAVQTYQDAKKVGAAYQAFGQTVQRDPKRYAHFVLQEALNARYKQAVQYAEAVEKHEAEVQKQALAALKTATTQSDIGVLNALIAASKERLDLAHAKATQAKGELDAFRGQLGVEEARKAEADREWAQNIVDEMRKKALAAYNAQFPSPGAAE